MSKAVIAQSAPYPVDVAAGQKYFWCACGRSGNQPFCDGSHESTGLASVAWRAERSKTLYFCGCKQTDNAPFCDGAHAKL